MTDRKSYIKSLHRKGYKYVRIAEILNISRQRVNQILNPKKHQAREKLNSYVKSGDIEKKPCEYTGCNKVKTQAHHPDHNKPLEVIWVCTEHHGMFHSSLESIIRKQKKEELRNSKRACLNCNEFFTSKNLGMKHCDRVECKKARVLKWNHNWNYKDGLTYHMRNEHRRINQKLYQQRWWDNLSEEQKAEQRKRVSNYQKEYQRKKKSGQLLKGNQK